MPQPWLLDVNVPVAQHAASRGWGALKNGVLVETASSQGFVCVLTRDRLFGESAARALKSFPQSASPFDATGVDVPMDSGLRTFTWP